MLPSPEVWAGSLSMFVPSATFSSDVGTDDGLYFGNLGAPVALDADGFLAALDIGTSIQTKGVADFRTTYVAGTTMGRYGRNITAVASGTAVTTVILRGRDYLGQKMQETLTLNGATAVNGKKAFYTLEQVVAAVTAARTVDIGWGDVLGLPFKTHAVLRTTENAISGGTDEQTATVLAAAASVVGATASAFEAPFDGYLIGWRGRYTTAMTTASSTVTAFNNAVAKTAGDGVAPIGAIGLMFGKDIPYASWVPVSKGDSVTLSATGGTAGAADLVAIFARPRAIFAAADATAIATATTGDPRGTFKPFNATDGAKIYTVIAKADRTNLYGVAHYTP